MVHTNLSLVCRLVGPICDSDLANKLLKDYRRTIIGTLRKNKPQIPTELTKLRRLFGFQKHSTMVSYILRKNENVILLSTIHLDDEIGSETGRPAIIIDYNKRKIGVDIIVQSLARACWWPMVLLNELLNVAGINAFVIYIPDHKKILSDENFWKY